MPSTVVYTGAVPPGELLRLPEMVAIPSNADVGQPWPSRVWTVPTIGMPTVCDRRTSTSNEQAPAAVRVGIGADGVKSPPGELIELPATVDQVVEPGARHGTTIQRKNVTLWPGRSVSACPPPELCARRWSTPELTLAFQSFCPKRPSSRSRHGLQDQLAAATLKPPGMVTSAEPSRALDELLDVFDNVSVSMKVAPRTAPLCENVAANVAGGGGGGAPCEALARCTKPPAR